MRIASFILGKDRILLIVFQISPFHRTGCQFTKQPQYTFLVLAFFRFPCKTALFYVYAYLEGTSPKNKTIGLISHMDTSPDASGENITPNIIESYSGSVIKLNDNISLDPSEFPSLKEKLGHTLITTSGNTLLGADDKAGICIIVSTVERIIKNNLPHPNLIITFTPDEEIGEGTKNFNYQYYKEHNCNFAYTIDGGDINYISYENFNAASCEIIVTGKSIHPGDAKNKMVNSIQVAMEFNALLPVNQRPEYTEGYEGF